MVVFEWCLRITLISALADTSVTRAGWDRTCSSYNPNDILRKKMKANRPLPFNINLSSHIYTSRSSILVNIEGPHNSSFSVQMRPLNSQKRVGEFQTIPPLQLQPVVCQGFVVNSAGPLTPSNVTFRWLGPPTDEGTLALMGTFVSGNEYWETKGEEKRTRLFYREPGLWRDGCGTIHLGDKEGCEQPECEYHLFYELNGDKKTVKVKMRRDVRREDIYMGMIITNDINQDVGSDMGIYCIFTKKWAKVKRENEIESIIAGMPKIDNDHCTFPISVESLNRTVGTPSYLAYFWGNVNPNTGEIIRPPPQSIKDLFVPFTLDSSSGGSCYFKNSSMSQFSMSTVFITFVIMYLVLPLSIISLATIEFGKVPR